MTSGMSTLSDKGGMGLEGGIYDINTGARGVGSVFGSLVIDEFVNYTISTMYFVKFLSVKRNGEFYIKGACGFTVLGKSFRTGFKWHIR